MSANQRREEDLSTSQVVTLTLDDDQEVECSILTTLKVDGTEYIALTPMEEEEDPEGGDVWLYRFLRDPAGGTDHELENIEDDEEYENVAEAFDEWLDEQTYEEIDWKE